MSRHLKAGFIGLGAMGEPMARHLAAAGYLATVWNRTYSKAESLAGHVGCQVAEELNLLAQSCDVIFICVAADADLIAVIDALEPSLRADQIIVDHSTVAPATARMLAARLLQHSARFLDAPISGGVEGARNGQLSVMVGGESDVLEQVRPLMNTYSARITHMGEVGNGQATKAVNQVLIAGIAEAVCEGLALGDALNLPREELLQVLQAGAAGCWFLEKRGETMLNDEFEQGFKLSLLLKDLRILDQMAKDDGLRLPVVESSLRDYTELVRRGDGNNDISGLIRLKRDGIQYE